MKKILLTKHFSEEELRKENDEHYRFDAFDFIQIEALNWNKIKPNIDLRTSNYILSSIRSAQLIKDLKGFPIFYVVGEKSEKYLKNAGHHVAFSANYATELVKFIEENLKEKTIFNFFCSQIRRDTIPDSLRNLDMKSMKSFVITH